MQAKIINENLFRLPIGMVLEVESYDSVAVYCEHEGKTLLFIRDEEVELKG